MVPSPSCAPVLSTLPWLSEQHPCLCKVSTSATLFPLPSPLGASVPWLRAAFTTWMPPSPTPTGKLALRFKMKVSCLHRLLSLCFSTSVLIYINTCVIFSASISISTPRLAAPHKAEAFRHFLKFSLQSLAACLRLRISSKFAKQLKQSPGQDFLLSRNLANRILPHWLSTPMAHCFLKMRTLLRCRPTS